MNKNRKMGPLAEQIYRICVMSAIAAVAGFIWGANGVMIALAISVVMLGVEIVIEILSKPTKTTIGHIVITALCVVGIFVSSAYKRAKKEYDAIVNYTSTLACEEFLNNHTHLFRGRVLDLYLDCATEKGIFELDKFAERYPHTTQGKDAADRATQIADEFYKQAEQVDYTDSWERYCYQVPDRYLADAKERAERAELRDWGTDDAAWKTAQKRNEIKYYEKYLDKYPDGAHRKGAKKCIIDIRVRNIKANSKALLPSATMISSNNSSIATQHITNDTGYTLTVLYSGKKQSYEFTIENKQTRTFNISTGSYDIAATVSNPCIGGSYRQEDFSGGAYSTLYFVKQESVIKP